MIHVMYIEDRTHANQCNDKLKYIYILIHGKYRIFNNFNFRLNKKAKFQLEKDLKDKFSAINVDEYCAELRNNSAGLRFKDGAAKIEAK